MDFEKLKNFCPLCWLENATQEEVDKIIEQVRDNLRNSMELSMKWGDEMIPPEDTETR